MARPSAWRIDRGLATALGDVIGWSPGDGAGALVVALTGRLPVGSTAKLEAVAAGEVPPGADAVALAARVVADAEAGVAGPSWSCWVMSTLHAALLETSGVARAEVVATRRIDRRAPPVDVHSAVVADDGTATWICDPYFGLVLPGPGSDEVEVIERGLWGLRSDGPGPAGTSRWSYRVAGRRWPEQLRYRVLAPSLDPGDVRGFCLVSVTHSGVPPRPNARVRDLEGSVEAWTNDDGTATVRRWRWGGADGLWAPDAERHDLPSWVAATEVFTDLSGVPVR